MEGIIKFFNLQKGYGFIKSIDSSDDSRDIFFNESDVSNVPVFFNKGDCVIFDLVEHYGKLHAFHVLKLKKFIRRR